MAFHVNKFTEQTGLMYDKNDFLFHGVMDGYPVFVQYLAHRSSLIVHVYVKQSAMVSGEYMNLQAWYQQWRLEHIGIADVCYSGVHLYAIISIPKKDADNRTAEDFFFFMESLKQNSLIPCCGGCGTEENLHPFVYNSNGLCLCPQCETNVELRSQENQSSRSAVKPKIWGIVLGSLIGCVVLFICTFVLWKMGFIAYASGLLGVLVAAVCIHKFAGRLSISGAVTAAALCLVTAVFTPFFCIAEYEANWNRDKLVSPTLISLIEATDELDQEKDIMTDKELEAAAGCSRAELEEQLRKAHELIEHLETHQTIGACLVDLDAILSGEDNVDNRKYLIKLLLWGVLATIGAALTIMPKIISDDSGHYDFRRLDA